MLREHNEKCLPEFDTLWKAAGRKVPLMPVRAENLSVFVELVPQTLMNKALDYLVIITERSIPDPRHLPPA